MGSWIRKGSPVLLGAALAASLLSVGCTEQVRVDDPYHGDSHVWSEEAPHYSQWERDTHRDHVDFNKRNDADKKEYWDWRHQGH